MKKLLILILTTIGIIGSTYAQSNSCATATPIILSNGSACVTGTTIGATSDNVLYGTCNSVSVNEVWYTYTVSGANNSFSVSSLGLTNAQIVLYTVGCGAVLEGCWNVSGSTTLNASWGFSPGTQVWIGVMSNQGIEGGFQLCVNSVAPAPVGGNLCSTAIPVCEIGQVYTINMAPLSASGTWPSCFWASVNQDVWIQFTVTQSGTIQWTALPQYSNNELDWAMFNITSGCPGTEVACNYSYDFANGSPVGMNNGITCVTCPTDLAVGPCGEYCAEMAVVAGQTYAIMIDIYSGTIGTLDFQFTNGTTAAIAPVADFTVSPSVVCGPSMTVNITDNSIGSPINWDFGDGNTYTGANPPSELYNTPGTYAITATIPDPMCPATHTEFIQLVAPVTGATIETDESCPGSCDGASVSNSIVGGDGVYSYNWLNASSSSIGTGLSVSGLCAGNYTLEITSSTCPVLSIPLVIGTTNPLDDASFTTTPTCDGGTATVTGTAGGTFSFNTPPGDGAIINSGTGTVTNGTPGATYDILYTTNGPCPVSGTQSLTALVQDNASFTVTPACDGGTATVPGTAGGTFSFNTPPGDGAVIDPGTGTVTNGTPGASYDILYTTNGACPANSTQSLTATSLDNPAFTMTATCDGGTATITGTAGGTFSFDVPPGDAAVINPGTGTVTNGTPGTTYNVQYVTAGSCPDSLVVQVTALNQDDPSFTMTGTCTGATVTTTATPGGTYAFNPAPGDGALIDVNTGAITNGTAGSTYTVEYTTGGSCSASTTVNVTLTDLDDPSFTMTPNCTGATVTSTATPGGTFAFNPLPGDGAAIDPSTGEITSGVSLTTYTVEYTTSGACSATTTINVTVTALDDASFTMAPTCYGGTVASVVTPGGTYAFNTPPGDGAMVDPSTGTVTSGTPGSTYDVLYTTSGACSASSNQTVTAVNLPGAPATTGDSTYCVSDDFAPMTATGGAGTFNWYIDTNTNSIGSGASYDPDNSSITSSTIFYVNEVDNGCPGAFSMVVITIEQCDIVIPTAFTPNSDNSNDVWVIQDLDDVYAKNIVRVYNRWGNLLYESKQGDYAGDPWDGTYNGTALPVASYYYIIEFNDKNEGSAHGTVSIILK